MLVHKEHRHITNWIVSLGICLAAVPTSRCAETPPDLIVVNANIITINSQQPRAQAFAVRNGRFIEVGSNESARELVGRETLVIDADGKTITPGFNDAHIHPQPIYHQDSPLAVVDVSPDGTRTIKDIHVEKTVIHGKTVFDRDREVVPTVILPPRERRSGLRLTSFGA